MKLWRVVALALVFTAVAHAQYTLPSTDFFLQDRPYDTFLRDYFRFQEPKPLRVEYWLVNWLDSNDDSSEFTDYLHIEGLLPIYIGTRLTVDIPFQYSHVPVWSESNGKTFGDSLNILDPYLMTRWTLTDRLKAIVGWEYQMKGDSEDFGKTIGKKICLLKGYLSYDLHPQLNLTAGARLDRYLYDTDQPDVFKLSDRLYYQPAIMLNWHPSDALILLLGMPYMGVHLELDDMLKAEARVDIDERVQIAITATPVERVIATVRLSNIPYREFPIDVPVEDGILIEMLSYTGRSILFELGWKLNPAALAGIGFRYGFNSDLELKDRYNENTIEKLDGKNHFAIGATFTLGIEALLGMR